MFLFQLEKELLSFSNIFWTCGHPKSKLVFLQIKCLASSSVICEDNSLFVTSSWCKWPKQTESLFLFFVFFSSFFLRQRTENYLRLMTTNFSSDSFFCFETFFGFFGFLSKDSITEEGHSYSRWNTFCVICKSRVEWVSI